MANVKKRMATTEMRMVRWEMGGSGLLERRRIEEILEEATWVELIVMERRNKTQTSE